MILTKLKHTLATEGFLGLIDVLLNILIPAVLIFVTWHFYGKITFAVYFFGAMSVYYLLSCVKGFGFADPSLCAIAPVWLARYVSHYSVHGFSARMLVTALCAIAVMWQWLVALFSGTILHGAFVDGKSAIESAYYMGSWWLGMNAYGYLATMILTERTRWYQRLYDYWFPTNHEARLTNSLAAKFKWDTNQFTVGKLSKDVYLLGTDNIPVSNTDLIEKRQELENAARVVIISINPVEGSPGDFIIRTGKFMVDKEGRSNATEDDLYYPSQDSPDWIKLIPLLNLGYPGGGFCVDLTKTPHIGWVASQGLGKSAGIRRTIKSIVQQFYNTAVVVFDPKGGLDYYRMQWDDRLFDGVNDDDLWQARLDTPMLSNFTLITEARQFKNLADTLKREYAKRSEIFNKAGVGSYSEYVEKVGYENCTVPRLVVVIEELRFIYGDPMLGKTYKDIARLLEMARAFGIIGVIGSQAPQQEVLTQLRDSLKIITLGATANQNEYLLGAKFRGPKMPGVCSLQLYDQSNTVVYGFVPDTKERETSIELAEAEYMQDDKSWWYWTKSNLQAEGRQVTINQNQEQYANAS